MVRILGHQNANQEWHQQWESAIRGQIQSWNSTADVEVAFSDYDQLFDETSRAATDTAKAAGKLVEGGLICEFGGMFGRIRGLADLR